MVFNLDCARAILLAIEARGFNESISIMGLHEELNSFSKDDIEYCCLKLKEGNLINATVMAFGPNTHIGAVQDLTYQRHEFLGKIKSDEIWAESKAKAKNIGSSAVETISNIASNVIANLITKGITG